MSDTPIADAMWKEWEAVPDGDLIRDAVDKIGKLEQELAEANEKTRMSLGTIQLWREENTELRNALRVAVGALSKTSMCSPLVEAVLAKPSAAERDCKGEER